MKTNFCSTFSKSGLAPTQIYTLEDLKPHLSLRSCRNNKSTWTFEKKQDCVFVKQQALKDAGYKCEIWVYNGKGEKVNCYI